MALAGAMCLAVPLRPAVGAPLSQDLVFAASDGASNDYLGLSVAGAGDVNGDGYDDAVVGAPNAAGASGGSGAAYVLHGSPSGLTAPGTRIAAPDGSWNDDFGWAVSAAGDVNGDGYDDVVVGVPGDDDVGTDGGAAWVFYGGSKGIEDTTGTKLVASNGEAGDNFGNAVSAAGDIDGDGYDDILVGAWTEQTNGLVRGAAYVYRGGAGGIDLSSETRLQPDALETVTAFGTSVAGAGDVDGDGWDDIVVGTSSNSAHVFRGGPTGIDASTELVLTASDGQAGSVFGYAVAGAGDLDADGFDDVVVGAFGDGDNGSDAGAAYLYFGTGSGLDPATETKLLASDGTAGDNFGYSVAGAGDTDGDGFDDVVIGAGLDDDLAAEAGSAYVVFGGSGMSLVQDKLSATSAAAQDRFGLSVASAGDANGDGRSEVLVGAYLADTPLANAGKAYTFWPCPGADFYADVDGDGFGAGPAVSACTGPPGYVANDGDCDDTSAAVNPGAVEFCDPDDVDEDCSGLADDEDPAAQGTVSLSPDVDGDGFGDTTSEAWCDPPAGLVSDASDCDDTDATVYPDATERCDGQANDCVGPLGAEEIDGDGDAWVPCAIDEGGWDGAGSVLGGLDCDDADPSRWPGAPETPGDGVDSDCDGEDPPLDADEGPSEDRRGCAVGSTEPLSPLLILLALAAGRRRLRSRSWLRET